MFATPKAWLLACSTHFATLLIALTVLAGHLTRLLTWRARVSFVAFRVAEMTTR